MDAIVLAGGYATRLHPITLEMSKPLVPVAGRPMIDYVLDRVEDIPEIDRVFVVTNEKFFADYIQWAKTTTRHQFEIIPLNDGTTSNADRLGAVGDIRFAVREGGIEGDTIVLGGDNLFDFSLTPFRRFQKERNRPALGCYDVGDLELVKRYSEARLDGDIVREFVEKPPHPHSTLIGILCYLLRGEDLPLLDEYVDGDNDSDKAGSFIQWLITREEVVGYPFSGNWIDIGTKDQLDRAEHVWSR